MSGYFIQRQGKATFFLTAKGGWTEFPRRAQRFVTFLEAQTAAIKQHGLIVRANGFKYTDHKPKHHVIDDGPRARMSAGEHRKYPKGRW